MEELRWHRRRRYPPSPSQCRIPTCILKESSHRHRMKLRHQEQKSLLLLLKMEQMRLQVKSASYCGGFGCKYNKCTCTGRKCSKCRSSKPDLRPDCQQGDGTNWENPVTQFDQPVKMKLQVADYDTVAGYEVVRSITETSQNLQRLCRKMVR